MDPSISVTSTFSCNTLHLLSDHVQGQCGHELCGACGRGGGGGRSGGGAVGEGDGGGEGEWPRGISLLTLIIPWWGERQSELSQALLS